MIDESMGDLGCILKEEVEMERSNKEQSIVS